MRAAVSDTAAKDRGNSTGFVTKNVETPTGERPYEFPWCDKQDERLVDGKTGYEQCG
jgi:hypothetical protein